MTTAQQIAAEIERTVPWMTPTQGQWLAGAIAASNCQTVVEIGTMHGTGTCYMAAGVALTGGHVHTFDVPSSIDNTPNAETMLERFGLSRYATIHRDDKGSSLLTAWPDGSADLVYVDGDHLPPQVDADMREAVRILRPGGMLVADDVTLKVRGPAIRAAMQAAMQGHQWESVNGPPEWWIVVKT